MILSQYEGPGSANAVNSAIMASAEMGQRHCRKADSSARQLYLHGNRSGVFHKMDRGKAAHKRELRNNQKVLPAEHSLLIRGTQTHNSGQRKILQQHNIQRILSADWHEGCLHISESHNSLPSNKLHTVSVNVQGRSYVARRNIAPKLTDHSRKHSMP
jgi:hypothetical protein